MSNVIDFAAAASEELKRRFDTEPEREFLAWLQIALRREAMVSAAYNDRYVRRQIRSLENYGLQANVARLVRRAMASAWAQEKGHQHFLKAVLSRVNPPKSLFQRLHASFQDILEI